MAAQAKPLTWSWLGLGQCQPLLQTGPNPDAILRGKVSRKNNSETIREGTSVLCVHTT